MRERVFASSNHGCRAKSSSCFECGWSSGVQVARRVKLLRIQYPGLLQSIEPIPNVLDLGLLLFKFNSGDRILTHEQSTGHLAFPFSDICNPLRSLLIRHGFAASAASRGPPSIPARFRCAITGIQKIYLHIGMAMVAA